MIVSSQPLTDLTPGTGQPRRCSPSHSEQIGPGQCDELLDLAWKAGEEQASPLLAPSPEEEAWRTGVTRQTSCDHPETQA